MKTKSLLLLAGIAGVLPVVTQAQSEADNAVVVTATRTPTPLDQVGGSFTLISADDIERNQWKTVAEALRSVSGMSVVSTGGAGAQTSVFTRGANSNHTLVLIDGIEATDVSTPGGAFDFAHLLINDVERIEVLTGPQAGIYGSNAIGGVINVVTKRGSGPLHASALAQAGSSKYSQLAASVSGAAGAFNYSARVARLKTDGESATPERLRAGAKADDDGYENTTFSTRLGVAATQHVEFDLTGRVTTSKSDFDLGAGEDPDSRGESQQSVLRLAAKGYLFDRFWQPTLAVSEVVHDRKTINERQSTLGDEQDTRFRGESRKVSLQNDLHVARGNIATIGLERKRDSMDARGDSKFGSAFGDFVITEDTQVDERVDTAYVQYQLQTHSGFSGTADVRRDDYESFDAATTYRVTPIYTHPGWGTRLKASYGTGFRAPSLYERYGLSPTNFGTAFRGNPDLKPEESRGWEAGVEQPWLSGNAIAGITYFRNKFDDLILTVFLPSFDSTTVNINNARTHGTEAFLSLGSSSVSAKLRYTRLHTEDQDGQELLRRPRHSGAMDLSYRQGDRWQVTASGEYVGERDDIDRVTGARKTVDDYVLYHLAGSYNVLKNLSLLARVENLFDREYEPVDGFRGTSRSVYLGVQGTF